MIIDAHVHVWDLSIGGYVWPDESTPSINRNLGLDDITPTLDAFSISGVLLVQAADTAVDTSHMLSVAESNARVLGVVAWLDLETPAHEFERLLDKLCQNRLVVGIRNLIHAKADPDWILSPHPQASLARLAAAGVPYEYVTTDQRGLDNLCLIQERVPEAHFVLDHLGKPPIGGTDNERRSWRSRIRDVAAHPNTAANSPGCTLRPAICPPGPPSK
ncbi:amidohydrolase family protein [Arthrobacter sp. MDT3-24]